MNGLIMAAQLIAGFAILVTLHELGHFLTARYFGIRVEKFYLFFDAWGFKLFSIKIGETEYGIGWLPLGGYVKIAGMVDESMDTEQLKQPMQDWEFRSKPAWQRLIVMIGGVTVNVILGIVIFWMLTFAYGETYIPNSEVKHGIVAHSLAQEIGLKTGDKITAINNEPIERFNDIRSSKVFLDKTELSVLRNDSSLKIGVPTDFIERLSDVGIDSFISPRFTYAVQEVTMGSNAEKAGLQAGDQIVAVDSMSVNFFDQLQNALTTVKGKEVNLSIIRNNETKVLKTLVDEEGKIGFRPITTGITEKTIEYGFFASLPIGAVRAWQTLSDNVKGLGKVIKGEVKASKAIQGPIGIAAIYGSTFDWIKFWTLTGVLSMILAFMNILPIPALDGGHTVFLIIEMIIGRSLSDKFMERAQMVGFVILLGIMVFAFGNDIFKLIN